MRIGKTSLRSVALVVALIVGAPGLQNSTGGAGFTGAFSAAGAQSSAATLSGSVTDEKGGAIGAANVTVINIATRSQRQATTTEAGSFTIPFLPPGTYTVRVERQGFATLEANNVVLNVNDQKSLEIQLKPGGVKETVNVEASADMIQESPSVGTLVDRQFVENMPLNGRSLQSLIALTPGVVFQKVDTNPLAGGQFSVNGQRSNANYFMVDGVSANVSITTGSGSFSGESSSGALPGLTALGGTNSLTSIDGLQEFKIQTSTYAPEFGRMPGGQISLITRSGTNGFHGDVFDYLRNDVLDANDWFANRSGLAKAKERQNDFGGVVGGPIFKNKTFFFFSYEGLRLRQPVTATAAEPTVAVRQAAPDAQKPFLNAFPIPNGPLVGAGLANFVATFSNPATIDAYSIRIDHSIKQDLALFGSFRHSPSNLQQRYRSLAQVASEIFSNNSVTVGLTWVATPTLTNDLRFNWTGVRSTEVRTIDSFGGAVPVPDSMLFPSGFTPHNFQFIWYAFNGAQSSANQAVGTGNDNIEHQQNIVDAVSWVKGSHQFKFGMDYRRITPILNKSGGNFEAILFNTTPSPNAFLVQLARGAGENDVLFQNISAFAQDSWSIDRRLTLTYGLRWDVNPAPSSQNGHDPAVLNNLLGSGPATFAAKGTPLYHTTYANFAPRFGVSYQLSQKSGLETVVRGGAGLFYDTGAGLVATAFDHIYPYFASVAYFNAPFPVNTASNPPPQLGVSPPQQFYLPVQNLKLPYTVQWNAAVEQSLGHKQSLTVSYVGSTGRRLLFIYSNRTTVAGFGATPIPYAFTTNQSWSNYNALQVQFRRRLSRGIQALASYTLSRSYDTSSGDDVGGVPPQFVDLKKQYAPSDFDARHSITGALTVDLPSVEGGRALSALTRGWGIDALERFRTALPTNVLFLTSVGAVQFYGEPNVSPGMPLILHGSQYPGGKAINAAALSSPAPNTIGNFPRNGLRFFNASQLDLALRRQFVMTERMKLQFRVEFFNIFNHPNFSDPSGLQYSPPFNVSTQTLARGLGGLNALYQIGGPRSGQASLKLIF
jgi:hypothetical protein